MMKSKLSKKAKAKRAIMAKNGMSRKKIGSFGVDSGTVWISDPAYIKYYPELHNDSEWSKFVKKSMPVWKRNNGGSYKSKNNKYVNSVISGTGGDGEFSVYSVEKDGRPYKIEIDL